MAATDKPTTARHLSGCSIVLGAPQIFSQRHEQCMIFVRQASHPGYVVEKASRGSYGLLPANTDGRQQMPLQGIVIEQSSVKHL